MSALAVGTAHNSLARAVVILTTALLVIVPSVFTPWTAHPFGLSKAGALAVGAAALLPFCVAGWRSRGSTALLWVAVGLIAWTVLAATRFAPEVSLLGSLGRADGAVTWVACMVVFLALAAADARARTAVLTATVAGAVIPLGYAALQAAGADLWQWTTDATSPLPSTMGRSNFTGDLAAMTLPAALALALVARARGRRIGVVAGAIVALIGAAVLVATGARAAWLGAAAGVTVWGVATAAPTASRVGLGASVRRRLRGPLSRPFNGRFSHSAAAAVVLVMVAAAAVGLLAIAVATDLGASTGSGAGVLARAGFDWDPASFPARLQIWRWSLPLAADRPLTGYGPDTAALLFPTIWSGSRVDRAHNLTLDMWLAVGLVGYLLYVTLVLMALNGARGRLAPNAPREERLVAAGFLSGLAAFWVSTLFTFAVVPTWLLHWCYLGALASLALEAPLRSGGALEAHRATDGAGAHLPGQARHLAIVSTVCAIFAALCVASALVADRAAAQATLALELGDSAAPVAAAEAARAVRFAPYRPEYRLLLARGELAAASALSAARDPSGEGRAAQQPLVQANALAAVATAADAARQSPHDAYAQLAEGEIRYNAAVLTGLDTLFDSAASSYRRALELDARLVDARVGLGLARLAAGDAATGAQEFERAVALDEAHARSFEFLGRARLALGDPNGASDAFARAVAINPATAPARAGHAEALCLAGKWDEGRRVLEDAEGRAEAEGFADAESRAEAPPPGALGGAAINGPALAGALASAREACASGRPGRPGDG